MTIPILLTCLSFALVLALAEIGIKFFKWSSETTRKSAHIISGIIAFFTPFYLSPGQLFAIGLIFSLILCLTKFFKLAESIHGVDRRTFGEIFFPLGMGITALLFLPHQREAFQFGILVLAFSDAFAALVGKHFGKHRVKFFGNKSLEGSLTFFITTLIILVVFLGFFELLFVAIALILTLTEFFLVFGLDNLIVPLLAAYLFLLLN